MRRRPRASAFFVTTSFAAVLLSILPSSGQLRSGAHTALAQQVGDFVPVTDRMLESPDRGDWLMWRRMLNGWGHDRSDVELHAQLATAVRAGDTGKVLWEINLGAPVTGYPVTYSTGGKQYVAISTGTSLVSSGVNR